MKRLLSHLGHRVLGEVAGVAPPLDSIKPDAFSPALVLTDTCPCLHSLGLTPLSSEAGRDLCPGVSLPTPSSSNMYRLFIWARGKDTEQRSFSVGWGLTQNGIYPGWHPSWLLRR